jgi:hypothetical protein
MICRQQKCASLHFTYRVSSQIPPEEVVSPAFFSEDNRVLRGLRIIFPFLILETDFSFLLLECSSNLMLSLLNGERSFALAISLFP